MRCEICRPMKDCPNKAITDQIDLLKCNGCGKCVKSCSYGAIRGGVTKIKVRDVDSRNVKILGELEGVTILSHPQKVLEVIAQCKN